MPKSKKNKVKSAGKKKRTGRKRQPAQERRSRSLDSLLTAVRNRPDDIDSCLELADYYYRHDRAKEISGLLANFISDYHFTDETVGRKFYFLLSAGYLSEGKLVEAEQAALRGLDRSENAAEFHFLLTELYLKLRAFDKLFHYAESFIRLTENRSDPSSGLTLPAGESSLSIIYNRLGIAYRETGRPEQAEESFRRAIKSDAGEQQSYLNLARLLRTTGRTEEADNIIEKGLASCRQVVELRMLKRSFSRRVTISACMMVRNEEELLPGCLDSIRDWVDEIIVVDTGSNDKTVEIARTYGAKLFHQQWENDFSKHRNYSVEQAASDWVFIIDADERMTEENVPALLEILDDGESQIVSLAVFNRFKGTDHQVTCSNSVRLWRRELNLHYEGIVHNALCLPKGIPVTHTRIRLEHLGYDLDEEKMAAKFERTMKLLRKQAEENPTSGPVWFNITQALRGRLGNGNREFEKQALEAAFKAVEYNNPDTENERPLYLMALNHVAAISFVAGDLNTAEEYARKALDFYPAYPDPQMLLGMIYGRCGDYDSAIGAYQQYLDLQSGKPESDNDPSLILYYADAADAAYYGMAQASVAKGDNKKAVEYLRRVLEITPGYYDAALQLGNLYLTENRLAEAREQFLSQLNGKYPRGMAAAGLGCICSWQGDRKKATEYYLQAADLEPDNPVVLGNCGVYFREIDQPEQAVDFFRKALALDNSLTVIKRQLAEVRFALGHYEQAATLYEEVLASDGDDPATLSDLGNCCFKMNQVDIAVEHYVKASELPSPPAFIFRNLGLALAHLGRNQEAISALERFTDMDREDMSAMGLLGDLYFAEGQCKQALEKYEKCLSGSPGDALGIYKLAECYRVMGHKDSAIMGYRRVLEIDPEFKPAQEKLSEIISAVTI